MKPKHPHVDMKVRLIAVVAALLMMGGMFVIGGLFTSQNNVRSTETPPDSDLRAKFAALSGAHTNFCAGSQYLSSKSDGERLQGSCCSPMEFHGYVEQVNGLKKYSDISQIPSDPYDIPASLAKELLGYKETIQLTSEQQRLYDEAMKMSHEGGPCCCKCWRWDAFEGQAKFLITQYNFSAAQIAEVWDLEDGCGGSGHHDHETGG